MKNNVQVVKISNVKRNTIICYICLAFLVILLFLPVALRAFIKEKDPAQQKIIEILNCNKTDESVSSTFLNGEPRNIHYQIFGNHLDYENADVYNAGDVSSATGQSAAIGEITNDQSSAVGQIETGQNAAIANEGTNSETSASTGTSDIGEGEITVVQPGTSEDPSSQQETEISGETIDQQETETSNTETKDYLSESYIKLVGFFSNITYSDTDNVTIVKTDASSISHLEFYDTFFSTQEKQQNYFTSKGFSCTISRSEANY